MLGFALKGLTEAVQTAKYNKQVAEALGNKADLVTKAIRGLAPSLMVRRISLLQKEKKMRLAFAGFKVDF